MSNPFNFYANTLAFSMGNKVKGKKQRLSDLMIEGDLNALTGGLIEQMERHQELAQIITMAAYNYLQRNGKVKPVKFENKYDENDLINDTF